MKLENQCCCIKQAKQLKALGIIQKSLFYYHSVFKRPVIGETLVPDAVGREYKGVYVCNDKKAAYSAFTVAELGVMLPDVHAANQWTSISNEGYNKKGDYMEPPNCFSVHTGETMNDWEHDPFDEELYPTEAQARAAYLIMLLEEKSITPEECNKRLQEA